MIRENASAYPLTIIFNLFLVFAPRCVIFLALTHTQNQRGKYEKKNNREQ